MDRLRPGRPRRIIDLFDEKDTRDELGLGAARDALSDLMFPGTSTIQTRLRYMLDGLDGVDFVHGRSPPLRCSNTRHYGTSMPPGGRPPHRIRFRSGWNSTL